jgi:hypothetical protein
MKITKKINFEEIEKLYINYYDFLKHGDIYYPPYLKELYINCISCSLDDLYKINLPITLEKLYIHIISTKNDDYHIEYTPEIKEKFKIPFGCVVKSLNMYDNPFEDMCYWEENIKNSKFIEYIPEVKTYEIKECIKHNKKYYIPIVFKKTNHIKLNF